MKKILALTTIVTLLCGISASAYEAKYVGQRRVPGGGQFDKLGHYMSGEELERQASAEACEDAIRRCQAVERRSCSNFRPQLAYDDSGYGVTDAIVSCMADTQDVIDSHRRDRAFLGLIEEQN